MFAFFEKFKRARTWSQLEKVTVRPRDLEATRPGIDGARWPSIAHEIDNDIDRLRARERDLKAKLT